MIDPGAGVGMRGRVLLVLLMYIVLPLVGGCSFDPECIAVPFLPQCFDDDDEEKTEDTAPQTNVRVPAGAEDLDPTMAALRQTLVGTDVATLGEMIRHLNEISLNLDFLPNEVVHRDDGCSLRVDGVNRALRSSLEASRAEVDRLDADRRTRVAGPLDDLDVMTLRHDERMRTDCRLPLGDERAMASAPETGD
jgi:hypothetical protein